MRFNFRKKADTFYKRSIRINLIQFGLQDLIYASTYAGSGMIKRVRRLTGGRIQLLSDNPAVPPLDADEQDIYLVGKVVWSARVM